MSGPLNFRAQSAGRHQRPKPVRSVLLQSGAFRATVIIMSAANRCNGWPSDGAISTHYKPGPLVCSCLRLPGRGASSHIRRSSYIGAPEPRTSNSPQPGTGQSSTPVWNASGNRDGLCHKIWPYVGHHGLVGGHKPNARMGDCQLCEPLALQAGNKQAWQTGPMTWTWLAVPLTDMKSTARRRTKYAMRWPAP